MSIIRGLTYDKDSESPDKTDVHVLTAGSIDKDRHVLMAEGVRFLYARPNRADAETKRPRAGDIVVCASSGSLNHVGKIASVDEDVDAYVGGFLLLLRPANSFMRIVLTQNLLSRRFRRYITSLKEQNITNLTLTKIRSFPVLVPTDADSVKDPPYS